MIITFLGPVARVSSSWTTEDVSTSGTLLDGWTKELDFVKVAEVVPAISPAEGESDAIAEDKVVELEVVKPKALEVDEV